MTKRISFFLILLLAFTALVSAQEITPRPDDEINPAANISWPPPVYTLRGDVDIYGSANLPDMTSYFIEFRPLELPPLETDTVDTAEETETVESPWFPATLPNTEAITDGVLGSWNTETAPDDLYELRLVLNIRDSTPMYFYVSPLRVENEPPDFVLEMGLGSGSLVEGVSTPLPTATRPSSVPTLVSSPTPLDSTARVTANLNANVRSGDGTGYSVVDTLLEGQEARVIGISTSGNGWYYIELQDGRRGWIAPSVVTSEGNFGTVPRIDPPASPTPPATATPVPTGNLTGSAPSLTPAIPTCNVQFEVLANLTNTGLASTSSPVSVTIQDVHVATGQVQSSLTREVPVLSPGQNWVVGGQFTISTFFNEEHRIEVIIDTGGQVVETIESDNVLTRTYTLQQGAC